MKRFFLFALVLLFPAPAFADGPGPLYLMRGPIDLDYGPYPLLSVVFNHSTHKDIKCRLCHHKATPAGARFVACTTAGCHSLPGARERVEKSMFMAYHTPQKKRSCYACHLSESAKYESFRGCQPCHGGAAQTAMKK